MRTQRASRPALIGLLLAAAVTEPAIAQPDPFCPGDCDADGATTSAEIDRALELVFDTDAVDCDGADGDTSGIVTAADILRIIAARGTLPDGCAPPSPVSIWVERAPLAGGARQEVAVAALSGAIYVLGGFDANGRGSALVERYEPGADAWTPVASLPRALNHAGATALDGRLYCVGGFAGSGFTPIDEVFVYEPDDDQWSEVAPLPVATGALAVVALDGQLHALGGSGALGSVTLHWAYDPRANAWSERKPFPGDGRNHLAAAVLGRSIYLVGGRRDGGGFSNSSAFDRYDPGDDDWTPLATMPTARSGLAAGVLGGRIVVLGGEVSPSDPLGVFPQAELYDPQTDEWTALDHMPVPRHGLGAVALGNRLYLPGGAIRAGFGATAHHDALEIDFE